ncbi:MAG: ABC transporter ATP-binding protein [Candidatus Bathyarchaeota archaeon]|nr:MAG: ABC transporter ATP-binding protein [Candidatus Bathyarchaeota archaeon]
MEMMELRNVTKKYGERTALKNISLRVAKGEILSIIGPNGSGKTTLLRTMAGIETQTSGILFFEGHKIDAGTVVKVRRKSTMVFQKTVLFNTTVYRNIAYGLKLRATPSQEIEERVKEALSIVRLQGYEGRMAKSLSGGEQQRVALARALALDTAILFLDEPTANLDPTSASIVEEAISWISRERKTTIVIATHNMFQAENLGERTALLIEGKIQQIGRTKEIFRSPTIANFTRNENVFSGVVTILKEGTSHVNLEKGLKIETTIQQEGRITLSIRPEDIILSKKRVVSSARNVFKGKIIGITDLGSLIKLRVDVGREFVVQITKRSFTEMRLSLGTQVFIAFKASSVYIV